MKPASFRLKLALLSGGITGALLLGCTALLWRATYRFALDGLDREIRHVGQNNLDRVVGGDHWERVEAGLQYVSGDRTRQTRILWVSRQGRELYRSPGWPEDLYPGALPEPGAYEQPGGPWPGEPLPPAPRHGEKISPRNPALPRKAPVFLTRQVDGESWRLGVMGNPYMTLVVGANLAELEDRLHHLRLAFLAIVPAALLVAAISAWLIASRALGPVRSLSAMAEKVTAKGLDARLPAQSSDPEFHRLITVFNAMLDRLEKSFRQAGRFSADASHELRTPLARLRLELEQALSEAQPGSREETAFLSLLDEVTRLGALIQKLLLLSQADAGSVHLSVESMDLKPMLEEIAEDARALAPELRIELLAEQPLRLSGDRLLIEQVLQNLVGNAVRHNRNEGSIRISLSREDRTARIQIQNTGPGIPETAKARVFERFFRADPARSSRAGGSGLGLSLSRELLRAHGGDLVLLSSDADETCFLACLPIDGPRKDLPT